MALSHLIIRLASMPTTASSDLQGQYGSLGVALMSDPLEDIKYELSTSQSMVWPESSASSYRCERLRSFLLDYDLLSGGYFFAYYFGDTFWIDLVQIFYPGTL